MGGKLFLCYEVTGFTETAESRGSDGFAPISIHSRNKVWIEF